MNFDSKKIITRNWLAPGILFGILLALGISVIAFSEPTQAPPGGNTPAPINVSGMAQTKAGDLAVNNFYAKNFSVEAIEQFFKDAV